MARSFCGQCKLMKPAYRFVNVTSTGESMCKSCYAKWLHKKHLNDRELSKTIGCKK